MQTIELDIPLGRVRGLQDTAVQRFLGLPYAKPPVGNLRFEAPLPVEKWDGVRDATKAGPCAPHRLADFPGLETASLVGEGWVKGDDYLSLNIWQPTGQPTGLPVLIFIHGGGFVIGSKDAPVHDGSAFARDGVICVTINYRLGIDGFLPIPGVPTNLGLRDQICALEWVRDNIEAFGGNPENITVSGESAGAMSVANLMTSPLAKGLFRRAIIQSGHGAMTRDLDIAQKLVGKVAKLLKVAPTREGFASVPVEDCLDALDKVSSPKTRMDLRDPDGHEPVFGISRFVPVHGDEVLPQKPLDALMRGAGSEVDLLIGTNAEEMNLYLVPTGVREKAGKWLSIYVLHRSHPTARKTLKAYGLGAKSKKPGQALCDAMNDLVFRWPARRFAEEHRGRTHMYEFEWRSPAFSGELGACHAIEMPFVFDTLSTATGEEGLAGTAPPQALADRVHKIWVDFVRDGALPWPEFSKEIRQVYQLESGKSVEEPVMPAAPFLP